MLIEYSQTFNGGYFVDSNYLRLFKQDSFKTLY